MTPLDHWHPVLCSKTLRDRPVGVRLHGENLVLFRALPHLDEVSIGHAIVSRAIFVGLDRVVREYLDVLRGTVTH